MQQNFHPLNPKIDVMPKFVIERDLPGIHALNDRDKKAAALNSYRAAKEIGPEIHWIHSYISKDKSHCVYVADHIDLVRKHAERAEAPISNIYEIDYVLEITSSEGA